MELNQQQVRNWLQVTLSAGGPFAVLILNKTGMSEGDYTLYVNLALAFVPGLVVVVWGWYSNRKAQQVKDAAATPGVQVHVDTAAATPEVAAVATDPKVPDVVPMTGGPATQE